MLFPSLFSLIALILLLWITFQKIDAWPFSHYPMFSPLRAPEEVEVYRFALEKKQGEVLWWSPHFYGFQREFGLEAKAILDSLPKHHILMETSGKQLIHNLFNLIDREFSLEEIEALHIVKREVESFKDGELQIQEKVVLRIPTLAFFKGVFQEGAHNGN